MRGPEFLVFYASLSVAVLGVLAFILLRRSREDVALARVPLEDPILIAYLRGGTEEAVAVSIASMVDRGLLVVVDSKLQAAGGASRPSRPIEGALLQVCAKPATFGRCAGDPSVREICDSYRADLESLGLMPGRGSTGGDMGLAALATAVLLGVGAVKLGVAAERGRHNVGFLIVMMVIAGVAPFILAHLIRARAPRLILADLQTLFSDLKRRGKNLVPRQSTNDLEYLAAVYGASLLPLPLFPQRDALFPQPSASESRRARQSDHAAGTATCGSGSSGASSSCGGGSGCGGGGGGGCGGCGS